MIRVYKLALKNLAWMRKFILILTVLEHLTLIVLIINLALLFYSVAYFFGDYNPFKGSFLETISNKYNFKILLGVAIYLILLRVCSNLLRKKAKKVSKLQHKINKFTSIKYNNDSI